MNNSDCDVMKSDYDIINLGAKNSTNNGDDVINNGAINNTLDFS